MRRVTIARRAALVAALPAAILTEERLAGAPVPWAVPVGLAVAAACLALWALALHLHGGRTARRLAAELSAADRCRRLLEAAPVPASGEVVAEAERRVAAAAKALARVAGRR